MVASTFTLAAVTISVMSDSDTSLRRLASRDLKDASSKDSIVPPTENPTRKT